VVNRATIQAFYAVDMYCCFPEDPAWHGKSMSQPHSGVPVPKHALAEFQRTVRVSGGDAVTEIRPAAEQGGMRGVVQRHNLAIGKKGQGKRSFVDVRPIAPSPASSWNDSRESWASPSAPAPPLKGGKAAGKQAAPPGDLAQPSSYSQGASSSSTDGWMQPWASHAPAAVETFLCPVCQTRTPRGCGGEIHNGYCANCRGYPWQCWNSWCQAWNPPRISECLVCYSQDTYHRSSGHSWSTRSKRRR
jgi:hypothetical protein